MNIQMELRVVSWRIPTILRQLGEDTEPIVRQAAEFTRARWSESVPVSAGPGNFIDASGSRGHYRDNIFVTKLGKNSFAVSTPVDYALRLEKGTEQHPAGQYAARAYAEGDQYFRELMGQLLRELRG